MKPTSFKPAIAAVAFVCAGLCSTSALATVPFTGLYIFGDSLSDNGNNLIAFGGATGGPTVPGADWVPTLPYSSGVYSNGPVWVNSFAAGLGLAPFAAPSFLGGGDYAAGGAKVGTDGAPPALYPPSLKTQLNGYLGAHAVSPTALYVIAGGGNDVRKTGADVAADPANAVAIIGAAAVAYATDVATMVGTLKAFGAQDLVVWNVPDLGLTPAALAGGPVASGTATAISNAFNGALSFALAGQSGVTLFDTFGIISTIATTGSYNGFSFSNTDLACGYLLNNCDASTSLFWDGIHPTAYAHGVLAGAMLAAVPEPGAVWLMMAGLVGMGAVLRRRAT